MELLSKLRSVITSPDVSRPQGEIMVFQCVANPKHPEWTEVFTVQTREDMVLIGFVGRLGYSNTWAYDADNGRANRIGRVQGRDNAIAKLCEVARI